MLPFTKEYKSSIWQMIPVQIKTIYLLGDANAQTVNVNVFTSRYRIFDNIPTDVGFIGCSSSLVWFTMQCSVYINEETAW